MEKNYTIFIIRIFRIIWSRGCLIYIMDVLLRKYGSGYDDGKTEIKVASTLPNKNDLIVFAESWRTDIIIVLNVSIAGKQINLESYVCVSAVSSTFGRVSADRASTNSFTVYFSLANKQ